MALTCKQLAQAWGIAVTKVTQAREPTFRKMARVMLMYPAETMEELSAVMQQETGSRGRDSTSHGASCRGTSDGGISDREVFLREEMLRGRVDREVIHPATEPRSHGATKPRK